MEPADPDGLGASSVLDEVEVVAVEEQEVELDSDDDFQRETSVPDESNSVAPAQPTAVENGTPNGSAHRDAGTNPLAPIDTSGFFSAPSSGLRANSSSLLLNGSEITQFGVDRRDRCAALDRLFQTACAVPEDARIPSHDSGAHYLSAPSGQTASDTDLELQKSLGLALDDPVNKPLFSDWERQADMTVNAADSMSGGVVWAESIARGTLASFTADGYLPTDSQDDLDHDRALARFESVRQARNSRRLRVEQYLTKDAPRKQPQPASVAVQTQEEDATEENDIQQATLVGERVALDPIRAGLNDWLIKEEAETEKVMRNIQSLSLKTRSKTDQSLEKFRKRRLKPLRPEAAAEMARANLAKAAAAEVVAESTAGSAQDAGSQRKSIGGKTESLDSFRSDEGTVRSRLSFDRGNVKRTEVDGEALYFAELHRAQDDFASLASSRTPMPSFTREGTTPHFGAAGDDVIGSSSSGIDEQSAQIAPEEKVAVHRTSSQSQMPPSDVAAAMRSIRLGSQKARSSDFNGDKPDVDALSRRQSRKSVRFSE